MRQQIELRLMWGRQEDEDTNYKLGMMNGINKTKEVCNKMAMSEWVRLREEATTTASRREAWK